MEKLKNYKFMDFSIEEVVSLLLSSFFYSQSFLSFSSLFIDNYFSLDESISYKVLSSFVLFILTIIFLFTIMNKSLSTKKFLLLKIVLFNSIFLFLLSTILLYRNTLLYNGLSLFIPLLSFSFIILTFKLYKNTRSNGNNSSDKIFEKNIFSGFSLFLFLTLFVAIFLGLFSLYYYPLTLIFESIFDGVKNVPILIYSFSMMTLFLLVVFMFLRSRSKYKNKHFSLKIIALLSFLVLFINTSLVTGFRYLSFLTPTYDFGLFSQMFHSMASHFSQVTTLERNIPLSHFNVHISPIFYLILPFYMIFKNPLTLQLSQAFIVAIGVIPLYLLLKFHKVKKTYSAFLLLIYGLTPIFMTSSFYDIHENCFLVPLILFMLYFIDTNKNMPLLITTILTLSIKEDAALYVMVIALYLILNRKDFKRGSLMLSLSLIWFLCAIYYLKNFGDGAMLGRFDNMISIKKLSVLSIPITILTNPVYVLKEVFNTQKIKYLIFTFLPLMFIPLMQKKITSFILIIPLIVMNLISNYQYQSSIFFQYGYGSMTLVFYLLIDYFKNVEDDPDSINQLDERSNSNNNINNNSNSNNSRNKLDKRIVLLVLSLSIASFTTSGLALNSMNSLNYFVTQRETVESIKNSLDEIPKNSSILATTFLTSYLSDRDEIYDIEYNMNSNNQFLADYVVIDARSGFHDTIEISNHYIDKGYQIIKDIPQTIMILKKR